MEKTKWTLFPRRRPGWTGRLLLILIACGVPFAARAQTIRIAKQYGIAYLPLTVIRTQHLMEKLGRRQGLDLQTSWLQFTGGASMNEALISGHLDIASGGVSPMVVLWARTRGNLRVRGIAALTSMPLYLNTIDAHVKTIRDFTGNDRIAMPAAGVSIQAITLMMAAAKTFGPAEARKLNPLTVSMSHPDGMAALLARRAGITAHFTSPPYMFEELTRPGVHRVLDSYDVLGGPATFTVLWTPGRFVHDNPKILAIFVAALKEADRFIIAHPAEAAKIYIASTHTRLSEASLERMIKNPEVRWTTTPHRTMEYARFMTKIGMIKRAPKSWKGLFFPAIDKEPGS
jgi:sulfonate transport system substrate-binding protein